MYKIQKINNQKAYKKGAGQKYAISQLKGNGIFGQVCFTQANKIFSSWKVYNCPECKQHGYFSGWRTKADIT